jgi:anhydro-N-acetylmuramic acid kinase
MTLSILGAMTGTSLDGIDAVCMQFSKQPGSHPQMDFLWFEQASYPLSLRKQLLTFQKTPLETKNVLTLLHLDEQLGNWYAKTFKTMMKKHPKARPDVIANHGQTVFHLAALASAHPPTRGLSLQIGSPYIIACELGITTIHGFRQGDLAAFGQGAPLAPLFHEHLIQVLLDSHKLKNAQKGVSIHNLGGFSNLSYFQHGKLCQAFDTGPANSWIDEACFLATQGKKTYDHKGLLASQGKVDKKLLNKLLGHSFFKKPLPKSTG